MLISSLMKWSKKIVLLKKVIGIFEKRILSFSFLHLFYMCFAFNFFGNIVLELLQQIWNQHKLYVFDIHKEHFMGKKFCVILALLQTLNVLNMGKKLKFSKICLNSKNSFFCQYSTVYIILLLILFLISQKVLNFSSPVCKCLRHCGH